jgi:predicted transcriptional regulator
MNIKVNILEVVKTLEIDKDSSIILRMIYGLEGSRPKTVNEVSQEIGRSRGIIYYRLKKMKRLGLIDSNRHIVKLEFIGN